MAEPNFSDVFEEEAFPSDSLVEEEVEEKEEPEGAADSALHSAGKEGDDDAKMEALRQEVLSSAEKEMDELFRDIGMVDPYTNEEIRSKADFMAWKKRFQEDAAAAGDPEAAKNDDYQRMQDRVDQELSKIQRWDEEIKSLEDIADSENFDAIYERVIRGYDLSDAVYLANADVYRRRVADRAEQAAINRLRSKEHLVGVQTRGGGETVVPRDVMAEFKRLMPKASGEEIRKFYRKDQAHLKK